MRFTVNALARLMAELVDEGHGRNIVCVDKSTFRHDCESDGVTILEVAGVGIEWIRTADPAGGTKHRSDGSEAGRSLCVLAGGLGADSKGNLIPITD